MNFLKSLPARAILFLISIGLFAFMANENIKINGKIDTFTWLFLIIVALNTFNLYLAWKRSKS